MKLDKLYQRSKELEIDDQTKIVIMSDCHRGKGGSDDNFMKNKHIFEVALNNYYYKNFTYIELGDGDEMWEVRNYKDIIEEYLGTFKQLKKFHDVNRLVMIYGNHDLSKKSSSTLKKYFYHYENKETNEKEDLLVGLKVYESLVLHYGGHDIFLLHGHQVDFLNSTLWKVSRFLVHYVWRNLEKIGVKDPTSAAKNYQVTKKIEEKLQKWSIEQDKIVIAGHTHRPIFPKKGQSLYFNDGSCIHPNGITAIEIENGKISLVKWQYRVSDGNFISVGREVIAAPVKIVDFF